MKIRAFLSAVVCAAALLPAAARADDGRQFEAIAYEYNVNASPQIHSSRFDCKVNVLEQGTVKVVELRSFITAKPDPDVVIRIISSNESVASQIYNARMEQIAEYPKGQMVNENLFIFKSGDEKRKVSGMWYLDPDYMMSDFSITDANGVQLYKETVIYTAKKPSRRK